LKKHLRIITALLSVSVILFGALTFFTAQALLSGRPKHKLEGDVTANPNYDPLTVGITSNEAGLMTQNIWDDKIGAFRTCTRKEAPDHWRVAFVEDNTMMLWAMSKGMYKWSHHQGYGAATRDFILKNIKDELKGTFYMGEYSGASDNTFVKTVDTPDGLPFVFEDPYVPFMPLWGVVVYTMAYPNQDGQYPASYYQNYISLMLENEYKLVGDSEFPKENTTSSLGFFMASCANWYKFTGEQRFYDYAQKTFEIIKTRVNDDGLIREAPSGAVNPLRHIQTVWALFESHRSGLKIDGLYELYENTRDYMKISKDGKGIYLVTDSRSNRFDDSNCTQLQIAYGYYALAQESADGEAFAHAYKTMEENRLNIGTESQPFYAYSTWVTTPEGENRGTGTIEGNSMAFLTEWWNSMLNDTK